MIISMTSLGHLGPSWGHFGTTLGPLWDHLGTSLGTLGSLSDHSGQTAHLEFLRSFFYHFRKILSDLPLKMPLRGLLKIISLSDLGISGVRPLGLCKATFCYGNKIWKCPKKKSAFTAPVQTWLSTGFPFRAMWWNRRVRFLPDGRLNTQVDTGKTVFRLKATFTHRCFYNSFMGSVLLE